MPRTTKDATRQRLRDAVVAETVEKGIGAVSVAGVVKRAQVSAGTVYVHYANKDEMLRQVYMEIKTAFHDRLMAQDEGDTAHVIRAMWFRMFDFVERSPRELLFLEYAGAAKILTADQQAIVDGYARDIAAILRRGVDDGTLVALDPGVLSLLLIAPAMQLARGSALSGAALDPLLIEQTFDRVWLSIAA
ncbi:TetR/AcrR family transcriptional regulator [Microbulbifer sp. S227A]|uniref:TetR/AcrR family transcriptional regulator n=1 Tax=Microbulbifer sp. S227A TaxID=3415131 RepID=UPI003C7C8082